MLVRHSRFSRPILWVRLPNSWHLVLDLRHLVVFKPTMSVKCSVSRAWLVFNQSLAITSDLIRNDQLARRLTPGPSPSSTYRNVNTATKKALSVNPFSRAGWGVHSFRSTSKYGCDQKPSTRLNITTLGTTGYFYFTIPPFPLIHSYVALPSFICHLVRPVTRCLILIQKLKISKQFLSVVWLNEKIVDYRILRVQYPHLTGND